jgi:hypothetical protein
MTVRKFERDYNRELVYTFVNAFPKGLTSMPVSYGPADLLKVTVTFNYDRYVVSRGVLPKETPSTGRLGTGNPPIVDLNLLQQQTGLTFT